MPKRIPLESTPNYRFGTTLGTESIVIDVRWNGRDAAWYMDILDADGDPIRSGIKIVLGAVLGLRSVDPRFPPGSFIASDLTGRGVDAASDDLGSRVVVDFYTSEDIAEL